MNTHDHGPEAPAGVPEHEWRLQERARELARAGAGATDPELARHLAVATALRQPPRVALAQGFAERVAHLAAAERAATPVVDDRLERRLVRALATAMGLGAGATLVVYGGALAAATPRIDADGLGWAAAALACLVVSWGWARAWPGRLQPPRR